MILMQGLRGGAAPAASSRATLAACAASGWARALQKAASMRKYWLGFLFVVFASFAVLGFTGVRI
jgi:hypothetical protein